MIVPGIGVLLICWGGDSRDWCIVRVYVREVTPGIGVL